MSIFEIDYDAFLKFMPHVPPLIVKNEKEFGMVMVHGAAPIPSSVYKKPGVLMVANSRIDDRFFLGYFNSYMDYDTVLMTITPGKTVNPVVYYDEVHSILRKYMDL